MSRSGEAMALYRHTRLAGHGFVAVASLLAVLGTTAAGGLAAAAAPAPATTTATATAAELSEPACQEQTVRSTADADSWIDENSPSAVKGGDSILNVDGGSANVDTGVVSGRARALVRFPLPAAVPAGCVVASAKLGLFASEDSDGARAEAVRLASTWSETGVTWSNQPDTTGEPVRIWSQAGYMRWNVASQVEAMLGGANHGFLIRDAAEGTESSAGHGFYGREKGESPPELVIRFAAPPSDEPPGDPAPPTPAGVACGQVLMQSTLVTNDLAECPGDGLVIGTDRIIVDLGGHLIDGVGLGSGILNDGHDHVTVRNGALQQFDYGVRLRPETHHNAVERLALREHQVAAVELFDVADSDVRGNTLDKNGGGITLVSGTKGVLVADNSVSGNGGAGLLVRDSDGNRLVNNTVGGGGDLGIGLERATGNTLLGNTVSNNSDGGIELRAGSHGNLVESNTVAESGDHGILVFESDRNRLVSNTSHRMSDSGITLESASDGVVQGNDVRFNTGGLQLDGSRRNLVESNDASSTTGIGIELGGGSLENKVARNTANQNGAQGIYVSDDAADPLGNPLPELGNLILGNTASGNLADGIVVAKGGHTIAANVVRDNRGLGINAALGSIDGSGNIATGNLKPEQCMGVVCKVDWNPPETTITDHPADLTNSTSATIAFTGTDDLSPGLALRFECSVDQAAFASCTSPLRRQGLAQGLHHVQVRATDLAGNTDPSPASFTWRIDTTAPETTITNRPAELTGSSSAAFGLAADEPDSTFECSLDGEAFTSCATPAEYAGLGEGSHTFRARATDRTGNTDPTPAAHAWTVDTTAPETTITDRPADPTTKTSASFGFAADEAGSTFQCALDDGGFEPCTSPTDVSDLTEGTHTLRVRATDLAGNTDATPATYRWTVTTAPETTITDRPDDPTTKTSASFGFAADEQGSTFACALDDGGFQPCTSPADYADLIEGAHTFRVRATDEAGNTDSSPAAYTWALDTTAPETTITDRPADPTNAIAASFAFSSDEPGSFECRLDSENPAAWSPCASPVAYADLTDGTHTFQVRASDRAGNTDASSATYTWTVDTTVPQTAIDSAPADPSSSSGAEFTFSSEAGAAFECSLDSGVFTACTSPASYTGQADGVHTFRVRATDRAGNTDATPAMYMWALDATAPETTITDRPDDPTQNTSATFGFAADEQGSSFECGLDAGGFEPCTSPADYADLTEGAHTFRVRATDRAGNTDATPATYTWTVDTTAPETTIDSAPADLTTATSAELTFSSEPGATLHCSLDFGDFTACTSPASYTGLAVGSHTFRVRATDPAGNTDASPEFRTWTIQAADTTAPETTIDSGPADLTTATGAELTFSSEQGAAFQCSLDSGDFAVCTSPASHTGLAVGSHTFRVRATDAAGNTDASPAVRIWTIEAPDTTAPETTITAAPAAQTTSSSASFGFTASETGSTFHCALDAGAFAACTTPANYTGLAVGTHTFRVRATDPAGNTDQSPATHSWTIQAPDTSPPQTTITSAPPAQTTSTSAGFAFTASETGSTFLCALDSGPFTACTSPASYTGLAVSTHTFRVRATDPAGNTDQSPATHTWTVAAPSTGCPSPVTAPAAADAWIDQNSPTNNKGTDSILKVQSKQPTDNFRALVRFNLPMIPADCVLDTARLRLYAASRSSGQRSLQAFRLAGSWTESGVTWTNAPQTAGAAATTISGTGYREWDVATLVQEMFSSGANHGFLIRDAIEGQDAEQQFHAREKGENLPQLVLTFKPGH